MKLGPKIRVGGTLGKIGQKVKIGAGKVASNKWVQGAVGAFLSPAAAAALAAAGRALDTTQGKGTVLNIAGAGAKGYVAGKAGQVVKGGVAKLGSKVAASKVLSGGAPSVPVNIPGVPSNMNPSVVGNSPSWTGQLVAGGKKLGSKVLSTATGGGGGGMSWLDKVLTAGTIAANTENAVRQRGLQNKAMQYAQQPYDARAPLRARALNLLATEPPKPNLAPIYADPGNPYDAERRARMLAAGV